jgi:hypothetical protein
MTTDPVARVPIRLQQLHCKPDPRVRPFALSRSLVLRRGVDKVPVPPTARAPESYVW